MFKVDRLGEYLNIKLKCTTCIIIVEKKACPVPNMTGRNEMCIRIDELSAWK